MHLYDSTIPSGNAYKVQLLLSHLDVSYTQKSLSLIPPASENRAPAFLAINPNGKVPALTLDNGTTLTESDAILFYLAEGTPYLPENKIERAQVLQWMFFEQFSHEPYVVRVRTNQQAISSHRTVTILTPTDSGKVEIQDLLGFPRLL